MGRPPGFNMSRRLTLHVVDRSSTIVRFRICEQTYRREEFASGLRDDLRTCAKISGGFSDVEYIDAKGRELRLVSEAYPEIIASSDSSVTFAVRGSSHREDRRELCLCHSAQWPLVVEGVCAYNLAATNNTLTPAEALELTLANPVNGELAVVERCLKRLYGGL
jgi:hypothetical protein